MNHSNLMRGHRENKGMRQDAMAKHLGVSQSVISKIESGHLDMSADILELIYFEVTGKALAGELFTTIAVGFTLKEEKRLKQEAARKLKRKKKTKKKRKKLV